MTAYPKHNLALSRLLRKNQTPWEHKLWYHLRNRRFMNLKFKRQVPMGNYIVDFYCADRKLIIELDGGQHNSSDIQILDDKKESYLIEQGYTILRFWNNELDNNLEGVLEKIRQTVL